MKNLTLAIFSIFIITSCSSTEISETGCKFVTGTYESEQQRKEKNDAANKRHKKDDVDLLNGLLGALFTIQLSSDEEKCL